MVAAGWGRREDNVIKWVHGYDEEDDDDDDNGDDVGGQEVMIASIQWV